MNRQRIARVAYILLACSFASPTLANGVIRDGLGAISIGRGGTNIAFCDNVAVVLDNPAGMVGVDGQGLFQFSLDGLITNLHYQDPFTSDSAAIRPMGLPEVGLIRRCADGTWAWGVAIAAPAGFGAHFNLDDPVFGRQSYTSFGALAKILPAVACQVTERLSVGATLGVGISSAKLDGPLYMQTAPLSGVPALVDVRGNGAALVWSLGAQYDLSERTTLGLTYQSQSRFQMTGNAEVDVLGLGPTPVSTEFDSQLDVTWPRTVGLGVAHVVGSRHRVSSDLIWVNWASAFDTFGLTLENSTNPLITQMLGPTIGDQFPLHWRDSLSVRLGYEFFPTDSTILRTGYVYNLNQIPDGTLTPYVPAILEHAFSVGWGIARGCYNFDIAYQYSFGPDRSVGTSDLAGGDFNSSEFSAEAHWLSLAFTRRF